MANTEIQYLKNEIKQLKADMANLIMALIELKVFKIKVDENGNAVYDSSSTCLEKYLFILHYSLFMYFFIISSVLR